MHHPHIQQQLLLQHHYQGQNGALHQAQLPPEVPAKTPVCIGQLSVTALVLYPISYLNNRAAGMSQDHNNPSEPDDFAAVRLRYDPMAKERSPTGDETIHILTPQTKIGEGVDERVFGGDNFGVVEQKVATVLGPMLGKGLIRVDGKVRRGIPNVSDTTLLPLNMSPHPSFSSPYSPYIFYYSLLRATSRSCLLTCIVLD